MEMVTSVSWDGLAVQHVSAKVRILERVSSCYDAGIGAASLFALPLSEVYGAGQQWAEYIGDNDISICNSTCRKQRLGR
jgi:hypothetical protein